jgi:hypothetical protein
MDFYEDCPKQVRVGPFEIKLTVLDIVKVDDGDDDVLGTFSYASCEIELRRHQPSAAFAVDTLLHEIFHAICRLYAFHEGNNEERVCSIMATALTDVMRVNPDLLRWIQRKLA